MKVDNDLILERCEYGVLAKLLRNFKKLREKQDSSIFYDIKLVKSGENIGFIQLSDEDDPTEVNITWLGIDDEFQNNGYCTRVLKALIPIFKKIGYKSVTLEVFPEAYAAQHVYEKIGFKYTKTDELGLKHMKLKL